MGKKSDNMFVIFGKSVELYFKNFKQFFKYMTFPVLGQVLGLLLIFSTAYLFSKSMPVLIQKYNLFDNFLVLISIILILCLPGLVIFLKAFWEYLVAYGAVNSMLDNLLKSGRVYDFSAHTELIKRRTVAFVGLWLLAGIFSILAICPLLWVPAGVIGIYLVLIFQAFTFEPELSPVGCLKKSFNLIKGHFAKTFILVMLSGGITYILIPNLFIYLLEKGTIIKLISDAITPIVASLPIEELNGLLAVAYIPSIKVSDLTYAIVTILFTQIVIQYSLPYRSLLWGIWYKELNKKSDLKGSSKKKPSKKRPSEKLMEETNKKFGQKRLDKNILQRAMEKEEDE